MQMSKTKNRLSRRNFLKTAGAAGVGSILTPINSWMLLPTKASSLQLAPSEKPVSRYPFCRWGAPSTFFLTSCC